MEFYSSRFIFISNYYLLIVNILLMLLFSLVFKKKTKTKKIESRFQYFWTRLPPFYVCFFSLELLQEANSEPSQLNFEVIVEISWWNTWRLGNGCLQNTFDDEGVTSVVPHWLYLNDNAFPWCCKRHSHVTRDDDDRTVRDAFPLCLAVVVETGNHRQSSIHRTKWQNNDNMVWPVGGVAYHQESQKGAKQRTTLGIRINDTTVVDLMQSRSVRYFQPSRRLEEILFPSFVLLVKQEHEQEMRSLT